MAKRPVGYRSPFSMRGSPMKAIDPVTGQLIAAAIPGIITAVGSLFGRKKRIREQRKARQEMKAAREAYLNMQFTNPLEGMQDPYAGVENPYAENLYEDLTVNRQAADYLKQQQQQSQADIMQQMKGAAGTSGIAALAQKMADVGTKQARQASAQIAQQEQQNQLARLKGEQQKREGTYAHELRLRKSGFDVDKAKRLAEYQAVTLPQQQRTKDLYGLGISRAAAADQARAAARSQFISGLGQVAGGVAGHYAPGGAGWGTTFGQAMPQGYHNWRAEQGIGIPMSPDPDWRIGDTPQTGTWDWTNPNPNAQYAGQTSYNPDDPLFGGMTR